MSLGRYVCASSGALGSQGQQIPLGLELADSYEQPGVGAGS